MSSTIITASAPSGISLVPAIASETPTNNISGQGPTDSANVLRAYKFIDIFPTSVSEIALSYDTENAIEEFTVEFQVQYFEAFGAKEAADIR